MTNGVSIVREKGKLIPADYLALLEKDHKAGFSTTIVAPSGVKLWVRKSMGAFPAKEADEMQKHDGFKDKTIVVHYAHSNSTLLEEDLQPFVLVENEDNTPVLAVLLDGDFSGFADEKSSHTAEALCVQKAIAPRIEKLIRLTDGDLDKIMDELADAVTAQDWANFMLGSRGSILVLCSNGRIQTITVEGDTSCKKFDWGWVSNTHGYGDAPKSFADQLANDVSGKPVNKGKPLLKLATKGPKVTVASTDPLVAPIPGTGPQPQIVEPKPQQGENPLPLADPNAILRINVPTGMTSQRAYKWIVKRMPENFQIKNVTGLKFLELKRSEAPPAFLQSYLEQNKLGGLGVVQTTPAPKVDPAKSSVPEVSNNRKKIPLLPTAKAKPVEQGYPERAEAAQVTKPDAAPAQPENPQVVAEPLPVLSPEQKEELVTFTQQPSVKAGMDAMGRLINSPHGLEQINKKIEGIAKQFGGKMTPEIFASLPLDDMIKYFEHDVHAGARLCFLMCHEYNTVNKMLEQLTEPHEPKKQEAEQPAQQPVAQPEGTKKVSLKLKPRKVA
jgi:hypothetical protein